MKVSPVFFGGILWALLPAPAVAGRPQVTSNQAALIKQSSIVFTGTVSQLGATSFADVPQSAQTIVVRVDSVLKKPPAVSLKKGDKVTVEMKDPSALQEGTRATFYTEGWLFGSGVAVKELGHEVLPSGGATPAEAGSVENAFRQTHEQVSDQELQNRIASADYVVVARVMDVRRWVVPKSAGAPSHITEHQPDWHEAILEIRSVLKGTKPKKNKMVLRFPGCQDVAWVHFPKFAKNQQGVFFLKKDQVSGAPTTYMGGSQVDVYTCSKPGDWLPLSDEARIRSLLKK
jgi:hypothetical protein